MRAKQSIFKYLILFLFSLFLMTGCTVKTIIIDPEEEPKKPSVLVPVVDKEHYQRTLNGSTIYIKYINGKMINRFTSQRNAKQTLPLGKVSVTVEEQNVSDYLFTAKLNFTVQESKTYKVSSTHIYENDKIVEVEFFILEKGKLVTKQRAKRVEKRRVAPLVIPSTI